MVVTSMRGHLWFAVEAKDRDPYDVVYRTPILSSVRRAGFSASNVAFDSKTAFSP